VYSQYILPLYSAVGSSSRVTDVAGGSGSSRSIPVPSIIDIDSLERDTMGETWFDVLGPEFTKPYFRKVRSNP